MKTIETFWIVLLALMVYLVGEVPEKTPTKTRYMLMDYKIETKYRGRIDTTIIRTKVVSFHCPHCKEVLALPKQHEGVVRSKCGLNVQRWIDVDSMLDEFNWLRCWFDEKKMGR